VAGNNLKKLMGDNVFETGIMKHDCAALISIIEKIEQAFFSRDKSDTEEASFKMFTLPNLERAIQTFRNVFAAECRQASTYNVDKVGIYSTNSLIDSASAGFMYEVLCNLSDTAIAEYDASAKCLAFRLPTAAGFHMMRAIEFVLVPYVQIFSGRNFSSLNTNWGSYVAHLESVLKGAARRKPKVQNVDLIRQLKNNYRNPVMHADMVLTEEEARDIFAMGGVVISALAREKGSHKTPGLLVSSSV
jgi:hypothetical protein